MILFTKQYKIRRYQPQKWVNGYAQSTYTEDVIVLDVQPAGDTTEVNSEGRRVGRKLRVFSDYQLNPANQENKTKGDMILVDGIWYVCTSCQKWRNTILAHWECDFSAVPETEMNLPKAEME